MIVALACLTMTMLPESVSYPAEVTLTFLAGPSLLWVVCTVLTIERPKRCFLVTGAMVFFMMMTLPDPSWLNKSVYCLWLFTITSWSVLLSNTGVKHLSDNILLVSLLGIMTLIHLIQAIRIFAISDVIFAASLVPGVMALLLIMLSQKQDWLVQRLRKPVIILKDSEKQRRVEILDRIRRMIIDKKQFLDPDLDLKRLSDYTDTPAHLISSVINEHYDCHVDRFITRLRLSHAKAILVHPEETRTSIEAVALMSGFKSRSAFYNAFKKDTGQTPASFRTCPSPSKITSV
jgi:AraC-like DNA-binding protein